MHQRAAELRQLIRLTELVVIFGDLAEPRQAALEELPAAERPGLAGLAAAHQANLRGVDLDNGDAPADFGQMLGQGCMLVGFELRQAFFRSEAHTSALQSLMRI